MKVAFFASGRGSNFTAVMDRVADGSCCLDPILLISNNSLSPALEYAKERGLFAMHMSAKVCGDEQSYCEELIKVLRDHHIELIVLAGYMKSIPNAVLDEWANRVVNIHPALLPAFGGKGWYGHHIHEGVMKRGCQVTGVTIHLANANYDEGEIIWQRQIPVRIGDTPDTLAARVLKVEHDSLWRVLDGFGRHILIPTPKKLDGVDQFLNCVQHLPLPL